MAKNSFEKIIGIFDKLPLDEAIEIYKQTGEWLHSKIEKHQKELEEKRKSYDLAKEKIKHT